MKWAYPAASIPQCVDGRAQEDPLSGRRGAAKNLEREKMCIRDRLCLGFKPDADVEGGKTDAEGYKGIFKAMARNSVSNTLFLHCVNHSRQRTTVGKQ